MRNKERIKEIKEELETLNNKGDYEREEEYKEVLDDSYDAETLVNTYGAGRILQAVDEICFNMGVQEYFGERVYELEEELKELEK